MDEDKKIKTAYQILTILDNETRLKILVDLLNNVYHFDELLKIFKISRFELGVHIRMLHNAGLIGVGSTDKRTISILSYGRAILRALEEGKEIIEIVK